MFDLEQAIAEWRRQMLAAGITTPVPLEELELHLRDEIERQTKPGVDAQEAFNFAIREIGQAAALKSEFSKAGGPIHERIKQFIFTLSGIPNFELATTMNTSASNIEPAWATYLKATAFMAPAGLLWLFSLIFLFPRLQMICAQAHTPLFNFGRFPVIIQFWGGIGELVFFPHNFRNFIVIPAILLLIILEWRYRNWPRYRRPAVGIGVFLFNAIVLLAITMMSICALIAVPALLHPR